ncbi:hypothetical protein CKA32_006937 [Geitlerinema sp. FC II]|nr:hypothetical protein CKA32_006937 [Geitlerinema sp. FC II]
MCFLYRIFKQRLNRFFIVNDSVYKRRVRAVFKKTTYKVGQ